MYCCADTDTGFLTSLPSAHKYLVELHQNNYYQHTLYSPADIVGQVSVEQKSDI